jgi:competence protein ComEC
LIFKKHYKTSVIAGITCLTLIVIDYDNLSTTEFEVAVLDVGQGLSIVIKTQNKLLVFDTGDSFSEKFNIVEGVLIPYLMHSQTKKLDVLIVSHSDSDHSSNINELLKKYNTNNRWAGQLDDEKIMQAGLFKQCQQGIKWQWDGVDFAFLSPVAGKPTKKDNNKSCVLKVSNKNHSILISSDIEKEIEKYLIKNQNNNITADILIVPHHGSKTSSTTKFLKTVKPRYAIVSAGYKNKFKHPAKLIQQRYQKLKIPLLNTAYEGAISIIFKPTITIKTHRSTFPRYWHHKKSLSIGQTR